MISQLRTFSVREINGCGPTVLAGVHKDFRNNGPFCLKSGINDACFNKSIAHIFMKFCVYFCIE